MKEYMAAFGAASVMVGIPTAERGGVNSIDWLLRRTFASDAFTLPADREACLTKPRPVVVGLDGSAQRTAASHA
jgi:hypothetical protein